MALDNEYVFMNDSRPVGKDRTGTGGSRRRSGAKRVTSIDVAAHAGVSQATVARVFSSPDVVSPATRAKVEAAATELGYVPNAIARSLKSQRTNIVGAVVPAFGEYWQRVISEFSRQLASRGEQLLLFSFTSTDNLDSVLQSVAQYRVDGLILASANFDRGRLAEMQSVPTPVVAFNQPAAAGVVASVSVDNETGMAAIAEHLLDLGVASVQYVGGDSTASTDQIRYRGAAQALGAAGVACPYLESGGFTYDHGYRIAGEIAARDSKPDAVMVAGDELALGVIDGLLDRGVRTPDDVLVTGFDGLPQAAWAGYDLTTLEQPTDVLVEQAIDLLLGRRDGITTDATDIVVPGRVRLGRTTKPTSPPDQEDSHG